MNKWISCVVDISHVEEGHRTKLVWDVLNTVFTNRWRLGLTHTQKARICDELLKLDITDEFTSVTYCTAYPFSLAFPIP